MRANNVTSVLLTGSHRSGSTWIGKVLSAHPQLQYIHEPFNKNKGDYGLKLDNLHRQFIYVSGHNEEYYKSQFHEILNFRYDLPLSLSMNNKRAKIPGFINKWLTYLLARLKNKIPFVKDPMGFFAAPWIHKTFQSKVFLLVRHPAAFAASLKAKNWTYPFVHFLQDEPLLNSYLSKYKSQIENFSRKKQPIINQACLLWNMIYDTAWSYHLDFGFPIIQYEEFCRAPEKTSERIFHYCNLGFHHNISREIKRTTNNVRQDEKASKSSSIIRNTNVTLKNWQTRLTKEEIAFIENQTSDVFKKMYPDCSFNG